MSISANLSLVAVDRKTAAKALIDASVDIETALEAQQVLVTKDDHAVALIKMKVTETTESGIALVQYLGAGPFVDFRA